MSSETIDSDFQFSTEKSGQDSSTKDSGNTKSKLNLLDIELGGGDFKSKEKIFEPDRHYDKKGGQGDSAPETGIRNNGKPEQGHNIYRRPVSEIMALSESDFKKLTPAQLSEVDAKTLPALTTARLGLLAPDQLNGLLNSTFEQLYESSKSEERLGSEKGNSRYVHISTEGLQHFTPQQMNALTKDQLNGLTDNILKRFSRQQIEGLSPEQIASLKPSQIRALDKAESKWETSTLQYFTSTQARALTHDQLQAVSEKSRPLIDSRRLTVAEVTALTPNQLKSKLEYLTADQMPGLSRTQISEIPATEIGKAFSREQGRALSNAQLDSMSSTQFKAFFDDHQYSLTDRQFRGLSLKQIQAIATADGEVAAATLSQHLSKLGPEQIAAFPYEAQRQLSRALRMPYFGEGPRTVPIIVVDTKDYCKQENWFYKDGTSERRTAYGSLWPKSNQYTSLSRSSRNNPSTERVSEEKRIYVDGHAEIHQGATGVNKLTTRYYPDGKVVDITSAGTKTYNLPVNQVRGIIARIRQDIMR